MSKLTHVTDILAKGSRAVCSKLYQWFSEDTAKLMVLASTFGLVLAGISNVAGILVNKKVNKKEKQYLIPMEVTDSLMNIGTFYVASNTTKKIAEGLVDKGVIAFKNLEKNSDGYKMAKSGVMITAALLGSVLASNVLTPIIRNNVSAKIQKNLMKKNKLSEPPENPVKTIKPLPKYSNTIPADINMYKARLNNGSLKI